MSGSLIFLEPTGAAGVPARPHTARLMQRGNRIRLTLLENGYTDSRAFLADCGKALSRVLDIGQLHEVAKSDLRASGALMSDSQLEAIVASSDVVVAGVGHCGGCTVSITRAACSLSERNVPVVVMVTERFARLAKFTALSAGVPDVPIVIVPHPIAGQSESYHRAVADVVTPHLVRGLHEGTSLDRPPSIDLD